jgi:hypothetical protein
MAVTETDLDLKPSGRDTGPLDVEAEIDANQWMQIGRD